MRLAIAALDEGHVAEAAGREIADLRTLALEDGVGGDRGAQAQVPDLGAVVDAGQPLEDAVGRIARRRQVLPHRDRPGVAIEGDEVGEGAADVDADQITCHSHS